MNDNPELRAKVTADLEAKFDRLDVTYKTVNNTAIQTAIFIPKAISSATEATTAPVLVHFHGGALITGAAPDLLFFVEWVRDLAHTTTSILLCPQYRLAPETPAVQILDDIADFWVWLHLHLPTVLTTTYSPPHLHPDLTRVAAVGESAGGYLALQSALQFNDKARLRAVIAQYPGIFPDLAGFAPRPAQPDAGLDAVVEAYVKGMEPGAVRVSTPWPGMAAVTAGALFNGLLGGLLGEDPEGRLGFRYAVGKAEEVPPAVWVVQGAEDAMVVKDTADELVGVLRRERPRAAVKYTVQPGDHGFDAVNSLQDEWVAEGVEFIKGHWLK